MKKTVEFGVTPVFAWNQCDFEPFVEIGKHEMNLV